jgi:hypothetical protein
MANKLVRLQVWVKPKQKKHVTTWAKLLAKKEGHKVSESKIIRTMIESYIY